LGTIKDIVKGVVIGLIVDAIILGLPYVANFFGLNYPWQLLLMELPIWITLLAVVVLIPTVAMVLRGRHHRRLHVGLGRRPPEHNVYRFISNTFGVKWRVLYGRSSPFSDSFYAFCQPHPYCPECDYEMEIEQRGLLKRYDWRCDRCGRRYKCPVNPYDADEIVERLLESDIRSGRLQLK